MALFNKKIKKGGGTSCIIVESLLLNYFHFSEETYQKNILVPEL